MTPTHGTVGWTVSIQDFRGRRLPGKAPPVTRMWFSTKAEADERKRHLRGLNPSPDYLLTVSPAKFKQGRIKEKPKPAQHGAMDWTTS